MIGGGDDGGVGGINEEQGDEEGAEKSGGCRKN